MPWDDSFLIADWAVPCALYMNLDMKLPSLGRALTELKLSNLVSGVGRAHASQDGRCFFAVWSAFRGSWQRISNRHPGAT